MPDEPDRDKLAKLFKGYEPAPEEVPYGRVDVEEAFEPVAGDTVLGTLSTRMQEQFIELTALEMELEDYAEEFRAKHAQHVAKHAEQAGNLAWMMQASASISFFNSEAEAEEFFEKQMRYAKLHSAFWYWVRQAFNCWGSFLQIRQGWRLVKLGKKYVE